MNTRSRPKRRGGFTLIELGVVIAIIGIIVAFIAIAGADGVRRAEERATQGLIAKLDWGVTQRLDAILQTPPDSPNGGHQWLSAIRPASVTSGPAYVWGVTNNPPTLDRRAQAIALYDYVRMELPDSFVVDSQYASTTGSVDANGYPFNFGGVAWPLGDSASITGVDTTKDPYVLPLGHMGWGYRYGTLTANATPVALEGPGDYNPYPDATTTIPPALWRSRSKGIYGASYAARAAFNKLIGALPNGYDTVDNDLDGWIDEWDECIGSNPSVADPDGSGATIPIATMIRTRLSRHTHKTARAEALYAVLCEGAGGSGSYYSRDDFQAREVADTDGDGLPEFVDSWGEPLQFYRWPVHHKSVLQRGRDPYGSNLEARDVAPLDPANTLVAPAWWSASLNGGTSTNIYDMSVRALMFQQQFTPLIDPNYPAASGQEFTLYDRSGLIPRRAFYSRPLIVSGGPDKQVGIAQLGFGYANYNLPRGGTSLPATVAPLTAANLVMIENTAASLTPFRDMSTPYYKPDTSITGSAEVTAGLTDPEDGWGLDDISSQDLKLPGGTQ